MPDKVWRVAVYPFGGIFVAEALLPSVLTFGARFGGIHLITAPIGSLVAVAVDCAITELPRAAQLRRWSPSPRPGSGSGNRTS